MHGLQPPSQVADSCAWSRQQRPPLRKWKNNVGFRTTIRPLWPPYFNRCVSWIANH